MAKAIPLTPAALSVPQQTPRAATPARGAEVMDPAPKAKIDHVPLQIRVPREAARAIRIAAAEREQTISEFMLSCFHANIQS